MEAMLGLIWFDEEMETQTGWGNMHVVHTELSGQLLSLHIEAMEDDYQLKKQKITRGLGAGGRVGVLA